MNLIEQLGGYENSKGIRKAYLSNGWSLSDVAKGFHQLFTVKDLDEALLEYRRANNIIEVGDSILLSETGNKIILVCDRNKEMYYNLGFLHATDKEIKQGYRDE